MTEPPDEKRTPEPATAEGPRIGVDEWVARADERTGARTGVFAPLLNAFERIPPWGVLALAVGAAALLPFVSDSDYVIRVAVNTVLFALLALGLNVVVGWAGLLDLGFIAFYGFGAYLYAMLASPQFDLHFPALLAIAIVIVSSALLGLLLGLPSRRLLGDYLAIVTLFWAQIYVVLATNADRITLPWNDGPTDFTGGPNGITDVDPISIFGYEFNSIRSYLWLSLGVFAVVVVALSFVNRSRTGRAWRALREDTLAAELMSMPVNRLKLLAFMFGRRDGRAHGHDLRLGPARCLPVELRPAAADHRLRDGDPRRRGQHPGRRRSARSRSTSCSSCCAIPTTRARSSTSRSRSASWR